MRQTDRERARQRQREGGQTDRLAGRQRRRRGGGGERKRDKRQTNTHTERLVTDSKTETEHTDRPSRWFVLKG